MTNTGVINVYNMPEISDIQNASSGQSHDGIRLRTRLTGLNQESFALSWNHHRKGLLCSASEK